MITKPELAPKKGYVEVEIDGVREYAPVPDPELTDLQTAVVDYEYRLILLELGMEGGNV